MGIAQSYQTSQPIFPLGMNYNIEQTVIYILQNSFLNDEYIKLTLNGDSYEARKSDLKDKIIFNNCANVKNLLPILRLSNPVLTSSIQATFPEKLLFTFLQTEEGRIFKRTSDFLTSGNALNHISSTNYVQPLNSQSQTLARSNSNFLGCFINGNDNATQAQPNILNEITNSQNNRNEVKSLTRNNSVSNAKSVAQIPVSILKNKGQTLNHPVISSSPMIKITPLGTTTNPSNYLGGTTTITTINQINNSNRSVTPTRAPQPTYLSEQQYTPSNRQTVSKKTPYINFQGQNDNDQPSTPIGKSMFDLPKEDHQNQNQVPKTPTQTQTGILNSIIGGSNLLSSNNRLSMTPVNQIYCSNISGTSAIKTSIISQALTNNQNLNSQYNPSNTAERVRSMTPLPYSSSQQNANVLISNNTNNLSQIHPITPSSYSQSIFDQNSTQNQNKISTPNSNSSKTNFLNFNNTASINQQMNQGQGNQQNNNLARSNSSCNLNGIVNTPNQSNSQAMLNNTPNQNSNQVLINTNHNFTSAMAYVSGTPTLPQNLKSVGSNINIGQLLSQRSVTPPPVLRSNSSIQHITSGVNSFQAPKPYLEAINQKEIQESINQSVNKTNTPSNQTQTSLSNNQLINSNNQNNSQAHFSSLIVQNNPSCISLALGSILQSTSTNIVANKNLDNGSTAQHQMNANSNLQQPSYQITSNDGQNSIPYESVRNKFQQLRKMTGVRKTNELSHSPLNQKTNEQESSSQSNFNFTQQLGNSQKKFSAQKSKSISNLHFNNLYSQEASNQDLQRNISEIPYQFLNTDNAEKTKDNFQNNILDSSGKKPLTKNYSCNNIYSQQNDSSQKNQIQQQQKSSQIPYYLGRTSVHSNKGQKDFSNLPSLSNISQILYTQEDQSRSNINGGGNPAFKIQNSFLPGLSPIQKSNQGVDNSRSFACEALPLVGNNNLFNHQVIPQGEKQDKTPKVFKFNNPNTCTTPINEVELNQKQEQEIKEKAKEQVNEIIQRTVVKEFENLKQITEIVTQNTLYEKQKMYQEFVQKDDQNQLLQFIKNSELVNQTINEIQNCIRQNTLESVRSQNNQFTPIYQQNVQLNSQEKISTLPSRQPAVGYKNTVMNSFQTQQSVNNIFTQNGQEIISTNLNMPTYNSNRSNRFNNSQQEEDDNGIKKTCSINFGYNPQNINESIADNKNTQARNSQDSNESPCSSSLKISEINKPAGQEQINYGIKIFQAGGSIASTFNDLNSFAYKNLESQRQNLVMTNTSLQDNFIQSAHQNGGNSSQMKSINGIKQGLNTQIQSTQATNIESSTPKNQNQLDSYQLNTLSYSGTNGDITIKKQSNNNQSIQTDLQQKSYSSQYPNNLNQETEKVQGSQSHFPIQKIHFNKNSISSQRNATPNSKRESMYSNGEVQYQQQQQQVEYQVTPTNKQSYNHSYKQSNSFKELFENNNNQMYIQNDYQYAGMDDNQHMEQRKRNSSCFSTSQNEVYQSKGYALNPNEKQRQISIISELSITNSTPQKLINTATKQKMMDEIERQKNNRQGSIQAVSQVEIENIRSNVTQYWNNTCNQLVNQTEDKRRNTKNSYAFENQQQFSHFQTPTSQNLQLDAFAGEPIPTDSTPQNKFYEAAPSLYQNQIKIQNSYQNPFKMSQQSMSNFEIKSNIHLLQTPDPNTQYLTKNFTQSQENSAAFSKPPLQISGLLKSQRQNIQKQSIQKQGSIQFTDQSPPINQVDPYKNRQLYYQSSNNSSLSQVGSSQNRLSPQIEQQLINSSQKYRLNLKNSRPNQNTPGQSYQSMKMQQQKLLSSLNPQQLKSYQNSIENYNYAINGKQLFSEQIPQQNSHRKPFDRQQQYNVNQGDGMNGYIAQEERELTEGIQEEDEIEMQKQQNMYIQQSGAKQQQYMTQEQLMILEQHQIQQPQQQQEQQQLQEEYYDDLDSDNIEEEEENPDEISYQQQNQIQNDDLDEYGEQNCENIEEQLTQQDEQYYENNLQGDGYGQYQNHLQYQEQAQNQNQEDYELNEQIYVQQQQQNLLLQGQQNFNMQDPAIFNPNQDQIQQYNLAEQYGNSALESMQNNSLRSSKQSNGIPARRFEENLSSVKKKKSGLYNQKINFEGDNNFKLTDQPLSVENLYQSDRFQQIKQKQYPIQQYQSLQINDQPGVKSQFQAQQNKYSQNLNNQFDQNNQNPYFQDQYKYFLQQGNELVDEIADDQSSLSQISQSPLRPSQLQLENQEQQQVYEEGDQNNIYQQDENIHQNNLYQYNNNEEQQMLSHRSFENNNQINIYANQNEGDQIIQNKNYIYNKNFNIPQTENISVNALLQMNKRSALIENQLTQRTDANQVNLFRQSSYQDQQNEEQQLEMYSQPTNKNEFKNFNDQQEQIYAQQFKGQTTQMTQEESFYENRILADINLESGRKENQLSNGKRQADYEMNSQENLSYREGSQKQNSSRFVASAENVKKKNISRRIFNKSARYYNEGNPANQKKNLEEFEADQKKKKVRTSLQNFVEELNEISGRSARGLLDLSHRIQQSNSFILDRSNLNEKSFYQNEKSFQQNEKIFSNNNIQNQSDGDENSIMQNTMLTGGPNSNRKEYTNARDYEQRLSEYVICHKDLNEDKVLEEKKNENLLKSPQVDQKDYQSNTVFNTNSINNQSNNSYAPQTSVFQTGIQQQSSARQSHNQNNNDKNQCQSLSNDSPFVITTNERRRSNELVDEISIRFNEQPAFSHASFNQEQMQQIQQQKQELEFKQSQQIESNSRNNQQMDQQSEKKIQQNDEQSSKKLQDSPFIEDRRKSEKQSSQFDHVQLASFAHTDNFISIQQVPSSSITNVSNQITSNQQPVSSFISNQNLNSEASMKQDLQIENYEQNKSAESLDSQKEDLQSSKSENQSDLTASKKAQGISRQRPISEIATESKFVKQRQPHFENIQNKDTHARSQSNHTKKKKHFELSIDACNEVQKSHNQENKETPQFSEHGISSKSSSLFKSSKPTIPNKRQQIISFLDYQKTMKKSQE
ncbi:hypothetical protein ABPG72_019393 [Tetrahymena utriculariae]